MELMEKSDFFQWFLTRFSHATGEHELAVSPCFQTDSESDFGEAQNRSLWRLMSLHSAMCSRVSLPYRHGAVIPCWDSTLNCRHRFTSASSECFYVDAGHTDHTTHHAGWSSLPGDCCSSVECSSVVCLFCAIAAAVPPRPEDGTVSVIVLFTIVSSCVTDCNF